MKFSLTRFLLLSTLSTSSLFAQANNDSSKPDGELKIGIPEFPKMPGRVDIVQKNGYMDFNAVTGILEYRGGFHLVSDNGIEISAKRALLDIRKKSITLTGDVTVFQGPMFQRGSTATYFYEKGILDTGDLRVSLSPILLEAKKFRIDKDSKGKLYFIGKNAGITTHDVQRPNYWFRADETRVYPEESIVFKNLKIYAGDTPVFWLPYFAQPVDKELGYHFLPGARSNWGPFLLNKYGILVGGNDDSVAGHPGFLVQSLLDIRGKRGLGLGADIYDRSFKDNENLGWLKLYFANDLDPSTVRSGLPRGFVNEDRWKAEFKYRKLLRESNNSQTYADFNFTWLTDNHYLEDFEPSRFRIDPEPDNSLSILHRTPQLLAGLNSRFELNSFYQTDTRLPEIFFDWIKSPILGSRFLYEGHTSLGAYREYLSNADVESLSTEAAGLLLGDPRLDEINELLAARGHYRFHTWHEIAAQLKPASGVSLVPAVGIGHTRYWDVRNDIADFSRTHLYAGLDFSLKFSKKYSNVRNKAWGINELMHVVQPYASISYLSTDAVDPSFGAIDRLSPTTQQRPIKVGRFSAIDALADWHIVRTGLRNQLITKRNGGTHNWLTTDSYIDFFLRDPEMDRSISNFYNDITWQPLPWMKLELETQLPLTSSSDGFRELATNFSFMPNKDHEITLSYRYLSSHPVLEDSSQVELRSYSRLTESLGFSAYQRWELDDSTLESQQYAIYKDLGSWTTSVGLFHKNNRVKDEYGLLFSLTLKELPTLSIPFSVDIE